MKNFWWMVVKVLKGGAKQVFEELGLKNIDISISHDKEKATAICIVE